VELYTRKKDIFDYFNIEEEIDKALKRKVWLKSGGYIVIDQTEALTAIDVNTGKYVGKKNLEDTVLRTNLEAAVEIAKQLRLRDIGGIIIIDFIDMNTLEHQQMVVEALEKHLKRDRTKAHVLGLTRLGLVEMTRKKVKQGLDEVLQKMCPYCGGKGKIMSEDTMGKKVEKQIKKIFENNKDAEAVLVEVDPSVAAVVIGSGGSHLNKLEEELDKHVYIKGSRDVHPEEIVIKTVGSIKEVEARALPVKEGEVLELPIEEQHETNPRDGIARIDGYIVDVEGAGGMVGSKKTVKIYKAFKTYAKGKIIPEGKG
jgi:ribonuclease G